jgi:hypothetical protein
MMKKVLYMGCLLAAASGPAETADAADSLAQAIQTSVGRSTAGLLAACERTQAQRPMPDAALVRTDVWTERWPDASGVAQPRSVTGEVWTVAIQKTLDRVRAVYVPARAQPYYLDGPIVLKSGQTFVAATNAEFRLCPNANTCMIRNEHVAGSANGQIPQDVVYDRDIVIEGGLWTTLGTSRKEWNGNVRGHTARTNGIHGCHGVILLNHVQGAVVRNVTIRQSRIYGIHISDASHFLVDKIRFDENGRDGVHINGNSSYGVIRDIQGTTHDDFVALNAWEWMNVAPVYGNIHHMLVENVFGGRRPSANDTSPYPDGTAEIRLLPGTRTFADGRKVICEIHDCVLRRLVNIRTVKAYDQPNLEVGRDKDFCDPIGTLRNVFFSDLTYERPGCFQIAANADGFSIKNVRLDFKPSDAFRLVEIGPMSATYKHNSDDPSKWVELFSPDRDIAVKGFRLENVRVLQGQNSVPLENAMQRLVRIADQKPNPDYPKTTPRGGTGKVNYIP